MPTRSILFVDDDQNVLNGLRRMMHPFRNEFELRFATSGVEALDQMAKEVPDVVVSDMRMSGMTGADLLKEIYKKYPGTVRFILSGHSDRELIMQSVGFAHQYLAKPCDPEALRNAISRSLALKSLLSNPTLHARLTEIQTLPTPPAIYNKLVAELQSEEGSVKAVADIIAQDIAMTAKILQVVNSAFFGLPTRVESPLRAVNLLGLETVRALVLTVGIFSQSSTNPLGGISVDSIYFHSLAVGAAAKRAAKELGLDLRLCEDALMAGMMHDIGQLISLTHFRKEMKSAQELSKQLNIKVHEAEKQITGVSHADLGAHLLSIWGLPDSIVEAVAFHHNPAANVSMVPSVLTAVHLANAFVNAGAGANLSDFLDMDYITRLQLAERLDRLREVSMIE